MIWYAGSQSWQRKKKLSKSIRVGMALFLYLLVLHFVIFGVLMTHPIRIVIWGTNFCIQYRFFAFVCKLMAEMPSPVLHHHLRSNFQSASVYESYLKPRMMRQVLFWMHSSCCLVLLCQIGAAYFYLTSNRDQILQFNYALVFCSSRSHLLARQN